MDLTPHPHMLHSMGNQNLTWPKVLGELVDNAFDAAATRVIVSTVNRTLTVADDGRGVADIESMAALGKHTPSTSTALGMYGIGLKDAWTFCGGVLSVESVHEGVRAKLKVDLLELIENNWQAPDPVYTPDPSAATGTTVTLGMRKGRNTPPHESVATLAWMFTPALRAGRQLLVVKGKTSRRTLSAIALPRFIDSVRETFEVKGKRVRIEIGIVADGDQMPYGPFWISFRHRNINRSAIGCGEYSDRRMGGVIELLAGWSLTKNKDDLAAHKDDLAAAIHERIQHLLRKAEVLSEDVECKELDLQIEQRLNEGVKQAKKEARKKTNDESPGTVEPVGSGRRRRKASKTSDAVGQVINEVSRNRRGFKIGWRSIPDDRIGEYDKLGTRVYLNENHPLLIEARAEKNVGVLYVSACAVLADHGVRHQGDHKLLAFSVQDFTQAMGRILKSVSEGGSREVKRA